MSQTQTEAAKQLEVQVLTSFLNDKSVTDFKPYTINQEDNYSHVFKDVNGQGAYLKTLLELAQRLQTDATITEIDMPKGNGQLEKVSREDFITILKREHDMFKSDLELVSELQKRENPTPPPVEDEVTKIFTKIRDDKSIQNVTFKTSNDDPLKDNVDKINKSIIKLGELKSRILDAISDPTKSVFEFKDLDGNDRKMDRKQFSEWVNNVHTDLLKNIDELQKKREAQHLEVFNKLLTDTTIDGKIENKTDLPELDKLIKAQENLQKFRQILRDTDNLKNVDLKTFKLGDKSFSSTAELREALAAKITSEYTERDRLMIEMPNITAQVVKQKQFGQDLRGELLTKRPELRARSSIEQQEEDTTKQTLGGKLRGVLDSGKKLLSGKSDEDAKLKQAQKNDDEIHKANLLLEKYNDAYDEFKKGPIKLNQKTGQKLMKNGEYERDGIGNDEIIKEIEKDIKSSNNQLLDHKKPNTDDKFVLELLAQRDAIVQKTKADPQDKQNLEEINRKMMEFLGKDKEEEIKDILEERDGHVKKLKEAQDKDANFVAKFKDPIDKSKEIVMDKKKYDELFKLVVELNDQNDKLRNKAPPLEPKPKSEQDSTKKNDVSDKNPKPEDSRKLLDEKIAKAIATAYKCEIKQTGTGTFELTDTSPTNKKGPLTLTHQGVRSAEGADDETLKQQTKVFLDMMEQTGRTVTDASKVNIKGKDEAKLKKFLEEELKLRAGNNLSLKGTTDTPTPPTPKPPEGGKKKEDDKQVEVQLGGLRK